MKRGMVLAFAAWAVTVDLAAQKRGFMTGGSGSSTDRVVSAAVVASWMSYDSYADASKTTLLVLWRGAPGWLLKGEGGAGGGSGGGAGGGGSRAFQYFYRGGFTFTMEYDHEQHTVKILNETFSLKEVNVVLVDFVGSQAGPAIVGWRWIEPGAPAPPIVPGAAEDPIVGVIRRSDELFDYLRCDLNVPDPLMNAMTTFICGRMKPASR
jgi:hypothetical protein